jgi:two-component sensor histidine kinase/Tfp pilus assembly protein PilF
MNNKLFISTFFVLLAGFCFSQTKYQERLDSLHLELSKETEDSIKLNLIIGLLTIYDYHKPEEGLTYKKTALEIAQKANIKIGTAKVNDKIGRIFWRLGKFDSAYGYHFEALKIYEELGDKPARNYVLIEIGQDYLNDTRFGEAGKYLLKALKRSEESGDKRNMARAHNILTALYENQGNYVEASKSAFADLRINEEIGDKKGIAYATTSVATIFQTLGNNAEALKYFRQSLLLGIEAQDQLLQTYVYRSVGDISLSVGNFAEAKKNYEDGLRVADKMENSWIVLPVLYRGIGNVYRYEGNYPEALRFFLITAKELRSISSNHALASLYSEIGTVYTRLSNYSLARKYFDSSIALCKKLDTKLPLGDYYNGVQLLDSATGDWKGAYEHYKQYAAIKDSMFNKETLRKMVMSQMQYENEKQQTILKAEQEKKDVAAREEVKRQRNIRNSSFAILAVVLIFSIVAYRQRNKIAKEKNRSDQLLQDKELLLREIHHRVKNNLEIVSSLLALQGARIEDPNTKEAMQDSQNRVHSIGIVHQKLYQGENPGTIEMKDYFLNLSESILDSFGAGGRVNIEFAIEKLNVDIDTAVPLGLIVNELLTNTLKYAFPDNQQGSVCIKLAQTRDVLHLEVSDNGVGKSGLTQGTGFGGQLISLLTRQLNGSMKEEIKNGSHFRFDFKLEKSA